MLRWDHVVLVAEERKGTPVLSTIVEDAAWAVRLPARIGAAPVKADDVEIMARSPAWTVAIPESRSAHAQQR